MYQKMFVTSDGQKFISASRAARHDARRALEEYLRLNLKPETYLDDEGRDCKDLVQFKEVMDLVLNHSERLVEFAEMHRKAHAERDFTFEEVSDWVILQMAKHAMDSQTQPYSTHYILTTINKVWAVLVENAVADGGYSDLQCGLAYDAKRHFKED